MLLDADPWSQTVSLNQLHVPEDMLREHHYFPLHTQPLPYYTSGDNSLSGGFPESQPSLFEEADVAADGAATTRSFEPSQGVRHPHYQLLSSHLFYLSPFF